MRKVSVKVPSTSANLGPGFDVFGLALDLFYDRIDVMKKNSGVSIQMEGELAKEVPTSPEKNTAGVVALNFLEKFDIDGGVEIKITKGIKLSVGLGSSGASAAGVAVALNQLYDMNLSKTELVELASQGEAAVAGSPHADNVAAAIFGGFTIVRGGSPPLVIGLEAPKHLGLAVSIPNLPTEREKTRKARSILPKKVPIEDAVQNVSNSCGIVAGFLLSDIELIGRCMIDRLAEPYRAKKIMGYEEVKRSALKAGASGVAISGAGPSMIAVVDRSKVNVMDVAEAMSQAFRMLGVDAEAYAVKPAKGVEVIDSI